MKTLIKASMAVLIAFMLTGCSQDLIPDQNAFGKKDRISELIGNFYQKVHNGTRFDGSDFIITDISTESFLIPDSLKATSRSESDSEEFDIHTVTVDFGETTGYVILSDTPGIDQIFYYTEAGCVNDTTEIPPLRDLIDKTPEIASEIMVDNKTREFNTRATDLNIQPLVRFEWHQDQPFNNYAAYCTCEKCRLIGNHMPIGCVTIAVGQTIATLKKFNGTFYGNRDIDFDDFPNRAFQFYRSTETQCSPFPTRNCIVLSNKI